MRRNIPRCFEGRYWNMMRVFMVDSAKEMCKLCKGRGNESWSDEVKAVVEWQEAEWKECVGSERRNCKEKSGKENGKKVYT